MNGYAYPGSAPKDLSFWDTVTDFLGFDSAETQAYFDANAQAAADAQAQAAHAAMLAAQAAAQAANNPTPPAANPWMLGYNIPTTPAPAADSGSSWFGGMGDVLGDIGAGITGFLGGLGFGGSTTPAATPGINPYAQGAAAAANAAALAAQQAAAAQAAANAYNPPPPAPGSGYQVTNYGGTGQQQPPATTTPTEGKFFAVEPGANWFSNKLVIAGKFKIPYWFIFVLIGVAIWKRKQIMAIFKKKK